jgi:hypothetical protein
VGNAFTWTACFDPAAISCVCAIDGACCGGGWDPSCPAYYEFNCGGYCGP